MAKFFTTSSGKNAVMKEPCLNSQQPGSDFHMLFSASPNAVLAIVLPSPMWLPSVRTSFSNSSPACLTRAESNVILWVTHSL